MGRIPWSCITIALLGARAGTASAQPPRLAFAPPSPNIRVCTDVAFDTAGGVRLAMDVYRVGRGARPALIFFNQATGPGRREPLYDGWARAAASQGLVGILPDLREGNQPRDFEALLRYLTSQAAALGIDTGAIAVYAASGNVYTALPVLEQPSLTAVRAAVIYYGTIAMRPRCTRSSFSRGPTTRASGCRSASRCSATDATARRAPCSRA